MTAPRLDRAIAEAERFLDRARYARKNVPTKGLACHFDQPSKAVAATRRASLDLTRALADLRKS